VENCKFLYHHPKGDPIRIFSAQESHDTISSAFFSKVQVQRDRQITIYHAFHALQCGHMGKIIKNEKWGPNVMAALPNTGGALCSTPQFGYAVTLPRRETS